MDRVTPHGFRIAEQRRRLGIKQEDLAHRALISVRLLRDVERRSKPIQSESLVSIATELGVTADQLRADIEEHDVLKSMATRMGLLRLKLSPVSSALDLHAMAERSNTLRYSYEVEPNEKAAPVVVELLRLLTDEVKRRSTKEDPQDEFSESQFADILRVGRLNALLASLTEHEILLLANTNIRRTWTKADPDRSGTIDGYLSRYETTFYVHFCDADKDPPHRFEYLKPDEPHPTGAPVPEEFF